MLCDVCWFMLRGQREFEWKGTYDLLFKHHQKVGSLDCSAELKCSICRILRDMLPDHLKPLAKFPPDDDLSVTARLSVQRTHTYDPGVSTARGVGNQAITTEVDNALYRLDFTLEFHSFKKQRTFVLKEIGDKSLKYRTDVSNNTSSKEVFELASYWINECQCVKKGKSQYPEYPQRLISWVKNSNPGIWEPITVVNLVETADWKYGAPPGHKIHYTTLSHRWGKPKTQLSTPRMKLSQADIRDFKEGVPVETLPKTFRDAIQFASKLETVGYIWIDSLCILQDEKDDWLSQSAQMDKVYGESFLNISSTAAKNDDEGLFFERNHELLWGDEINLDVSGIPGLMPDTPGDRKPWVDQPDLRRCIILDVSFWDDLVNDAPVNKRGWVLQERVMAPRVLHFCKDQIAWECLEHNRAESLPLEVPTFQLRSDEIVNGRRLRSLGERSARELRLSRLHGGFDPEHHLEPQIYIFELWKQIVEVYSRMELTDKMDKIVALSGIARQIAIQIGTPENPTTYVAGLWRLHLESQLLWKVETVFEQQTRTFKHPSTRPCEQQSRAPSFSWASVDTHMGNGVVYGEVTDRGLKIEIVRVEVEAESSERPYGLIKEGGSIWIWGVLRPVRLFLFTSYEHGMSAKKCVNELKPNIAPACTAHVGWKLKGIGKGDLEAEEHANVSLDCFSQDRHQVLDSGRMFCMPAAIGDRINGEEYLICLLLQEMTGRKGTFRRIGLTKLSPWGDKLAYRQMLDLFPGIDEYMPCLEYSETRKAEGRHLIRLV